MSFPPRLSQLDGTASPDHYWWLASEWTNLLPVCKRCTRGKRTRFPVTAERAAPGTSGSKLAKEGPLLVDPCRDQPAAHLVFMDDGSVAGTTERGEITIDVLALNRGTLIEARQSAQAALLLELEGTLLSDAIAKAFAPERPYACMCRQLARSWMASHRISRSALTAAARLVGDEVATEAPLVTVQSQRAVAERSGRRARRKGAYSVEAEGKAHKEAFFAGKKWIEWIKIEDFKAINRLELTFPAPESDQEPWLTLLGENGTGKSSVLQAVALALMGERHAGELGLNASDFVRRGARRGWGRVRVKLATIPEPVELRFRRRSTEFHFETAEPKVLLLAYGATRLLPTRASTLDAGPPHIRIKNLFDPTAPMSDVESWMLDRSAVDDARFDAIAAACKDLLLLEEGDRFVREPDCVKVVLRGEEPVTLGHLSDGFQSVVALSADIMNSMFERFTNMQEAEGIVLVDELEAHLHPSWKIEIVERLRRTFPRVAFLVSTHDPLCLKGLQQGEIVVLQRDDAQRIVAVTDVPPVNDLRADQILTDPLLFALLSTRGDEATDAIARYAELISKPERETAEEQELLELGGRLQQTLTTQESPAQRLMEQRLFTMLEQAEPLDVVAPAEPGAPSSEELELRRQLDQLLRG